MPEFQFTARDTTGHQITGKRSALTADDVATQLINEALTPIDIVTFTKKPPINPTRLTMPSFLQKKVATKDLQIFCRQMYTILKAGIPLGIGVTRLAETTRDQQLSSALRQIVVSLNQGKNLYTGLAQFPTIFSDFFINLVKVGENSGKLEAIFLHLADYLELEMDTKKKIKTALRYPTMVIVAGIIAIIVINMLVIPAFSQLFKSFGQNLPLPTLLLIASSNFMVNYWWACLITIVVMIVLIHRYIKTASGAITWAKWQLKIPIIGWLLHRINLARFTSLYALVLHAGVPAVEGLELVGSSTNNKFIASRIKAMVLLIARGTSISAAIAQTHLFPPLVIQMITLGEETGNIDQMLDEIAVYYQREVDYDLARLSDAIEPIMLIFMGALVLILALGVFMPMWKIAGSAGHGG